MALKRRRDGKMWKDSSNFNFIVVISGLLYLMLFVTCEPVCYTKISLKERNRHIRMVDCDGTDTICWRFASRKDVKLGKLLNSRCAYNPEDYPVTHEKYAKAVTCSTTNLPTVAKGSFDCVPNSYVPKGNTCNLTCNDGFYPANSNQTVCEGGTSDGGGEWSEGRSFECRAITCSTSNLPTVTEGSFDCVPNSDIEKEETCNLTCNEGFYPAYSNQTQCKAGTTYQGGVWSDGTFVCRAITCSTTNLPNVTNGYFYCAPNSNVSNGGVCTLGCKNGFYPAHSKQAVCEARTTNQEGVWSNGGFVCFECYEWNQWNGSEYKHIRTLQGWEESRQLCENSSSHLVTIENKKENEFVCQMILRCGHSSWNGLNDLVTEGTWEWSDGTVSTYRNWRKGQPDGGDVQNCVVMDINNGEWHDTSCTYRFYAVCERNNILK